uniref:Uncharacterized protein n=1 Tax=Aplanochytrium stocchinoi TaxID=215587 RepID=A0A7S3PG35_9STRA|mmetsp:Transcript_16557/g.20449  ORF Transcript_16557/g.20449 Transcript_16557/m.20449 type:complete len:104 (-) Transcript_16557:548-859(-)
MRTKSIKERKDLERETTFKGNFAIKLDWPSKRLRENSGTKIDLNQSSESTDAHRCKTSDEDKNKLHDSSDSASADGYRALALREDENSNLTVRVQGTVVNRLN